MYDVLTPPVKCELVGQCPNVETRKDLKAKRHVVRSTPPVGAYPCTKKRLRLTVEVFLSGRCHARLRWRSCCESSVLRWYQAPQPPEKTLVSERIHQFRGTTSTDRGHWTRLDTELCSLVKLVLRPSFPHCAERHREYFTNTCEDLTLRQRLRPVRSTTSVAANLSSAHSSIDCACCSGANCVARPQSNRKTWVGLCNALRNVWCKPAFSHFQTLSQHLRTSDHIVLLRSLDETEFSVRSLSKCSDCITRTGFVRCNLCRTPPRLFFVCVIH